MQIGGSSVSSYYAANMYSSMSVGRSSATTQTRADFNTGGVNSPSQSQSNNITTSANFVEMSGTLASAYKFSSALKSSAAVTDRSAISAADYANTLLNEVGRTGEPSSRTVNSLYSSAQSFADGYNNTLDSFNKAPTYSKPVEGIDHSMQRTVNDNLSQLESFGFNRGADGSLNINENRFKNAVAENPQGIANLFDESKSFMKSLNTSLDAAQDIRSTSRSEITAAVRTQNFSTYQGSVQASSMASMTTIPTGFFLNKLA